MIKLKALEEPKMTLCQDYLLKLYFESQQTSNCSKD